MELDEFGWSRLRAEAERQGTTVEELLVHAALYFLADLDRGRFASRALGEIALAPSHSDRSGGLTGSGAVPSAGTQDESHPS
ncbi:MAG: hypothetical protein IRZ21_03185 [Thermoleophilaceae bacterium]|nr:hypothetical protein [Thermoleophilaceae bacterium]